MLNWVLAVTAPTELPDVSSIVSSIGDAMSFVFSHFADLLNTILSNSLLVWTIGLALGASVLFAVVKIVRKFGVKGKRFR